MTLGKKWLAYYGLILGMIGVAYALKVSGAPHLALYLVIFAVLLGAAIMMRILISKHSEPPARDSRSNEEALRAMAEDVVERTNRPGR